MQKNHPTVFTLATHNREDLLLAHLDILHFLHVPHDVLIFYSGNQQLPVPYIRYPVQDKYTAGAATAFLCAMQTTRDMGYETMIYRNADDWLFNHGLVEQWLDRVEKAAGYNWFGKDRTDNIALNEVYLRLANYRDTDLSLRPGRDQCERHIAGILGLNERFFRLPDREVEFGIGDMHETVYGPKLPTENNRWFNRRWQMIGSHNDAQRRNFYDSIRAEIPYAAELERRPWFGAWLQATSPGSILNFSPRW